MVGVVGADVQGMGVGHGLVEAAEVLAGLGDQRVGGTCVSGQPSYGVGREGGGRTISSRISHYELLFRPDYRFFTLRDEECDAAESACEALARSYEVGAAATRYELYVTAAQDLLKVRARLEVWDGPAGPADGFDDLLVFALKCPSGVLQIGDGSCTAIGGISLPNGSGVYSAQVQQRGRVEARTVLRSIDEEMSASPVTSWPSLFASYDGTEEYLIRVWFTGALADDDDDDETASA